MSAADKTSMVGKSEAFCGRHESKFLYWPVMALRGQIATRVGRRPCEQISGFEQRAAIHYFGYG